MSIKSILYKKTEVVYDIDAESKEEAILTAMADFEKANPNTNVESITVKLRSLD